MTGPEHYAEAERLVAEAARISRGSASQVGQGQFPASEALVIVNAVVMEAQVHATLALAAATALPTVLKENKHGGLIQHEWHNATWARTPR